MTNNLEALLLKLIHQLPLELFVFIASFIEEVIAPIPSAAVLVLTGTFAAVQERTLFALIPLVLIAALGKTIGAIFVYYLSDKISSLVFTKTGWLFKVNHEEIHELGKRITGGPRDYLILTLCRALPIVPSSVVSIGCGMLKVPFQLFIITTLIGTVARDSVFIYAGYKGTEFLSALVQKSVSTESLLQMAAIGAIFVLFVYVYLKRRKNSSPSADTPPATKSPTT